MKVRVWVFLCVALFSTSVFATPQEPERLIYNGKEYSLQTHPLEKYFEKYKEKRPGVGEYWLSSLTRGYVATFEIKNKELFLKDIQVYDYSNDSSQLKSVLAEFLVGMN